MALVALALLLAACSAAPAVRVAVPTGPGADCGALAAALPSDLEGRPGRDVAPPSDRTAAWGTPAVVLRCGVDRPAALTATSEIIEVDGVDWFLDERRSAFVFTTVHRATYVEVRVPASVDRAAATAPLVDLAPAVTSVPAR